MNLKIIKYKLLIAVMTMMLVQCERFELNRILKVRTDSITNITAVTARAKATIIDAGPKKIISHGHCWSLSPYPTLEDTSHDLGQASSPGSYTTDLTGLQPLTTYYIRAYAFNESDTVYGEPESFSTIKDTSSVVPHQTPTLITYSADSIGQTTAVSGGNITDEGDDPVIARGVCWSLVPIPYIETALDSTSNGTGSGSYRSKITGLSPGNTYYVRAYARNKYGTSYGNMISFTTPQDTTHPAVLTGAVTAVTSNSATCGGNVTDEGGSSVTARGICLGFQPDLRLENARDTISGGDGTGTFTCYLTNLISDTLYYVRAFATNASGTAYGALENFRTDPVTEPEILVDIEGNEYQTVIIGDQVWMAENLRTTKYADGTALISGSGDISGNYNSRYYFTYNDNALLAEDYGRLYTWAAVMKGATAIDANPSGVQGVCPDGWHVPSDSEWKQLESFLGMSLSDLSLWNWRGTDQGTRLKEGGNSGFEATMGGHRRCTGGYQNMGSYGNYWSTTDDGGTSAYYRQVGDLESKVYRYAYEKCYGLSVRCIKDED
ncbi:MAG: fibrobacter succinogenes major paralogous domain-containing protein [Bacteroidales bacterium]|nr:fibrobacter succinogenes major paralogous domain-containing protein [Bacteroidales bacterium]